MDEWIDVLDGAGNLTGKTALKSEAHRLGLWHRCFHCWVFGRDGSGEPYLLIQRRSPQKETWPDVLDVTVAGHLGAGEEPLDGRREIEEEIGLSVAPERLVPAFVRKIERGIPSGGTDREFHHVYLLLDSTPPEDFTLQTEEVTSLLSVSLANVERMAEGERVPATEFLPGEEVRAVEIAAMDLVGNEGDYLSYVMEIARRKLPL